MLSYNREFNQDVFFLPNKEAQERNQIIELENTVSELLIERESLRHEATLFKTLNQDSQKKAALLKDEVDTLRNQLEGQQKTSSGNCLDFQNYRNEVSSRILKLKRVMEDMQSKNDVLTQKVTSFGSQIIKMEAMQEEDVKQMKIDFEEKIKNFNYQHRCVVAEIIKKHALKINNYEATVNQLREQIIKKESEIKMCQMMLREMKNRMETEINKVKSEMETSAQKSEAQLKDKLLEMEKSMAKISKWNHRLIKEYESKLRSIRKDKEIQVQALQMQLNEKVQSINGQKSQEVEDVANALEFRYKKLISTMDEVNKKQRQSDLQGHWRQEGEQDVVVLYSRSPNKMNSSTEQLCNNSKKIQQLETQLENQNQEKMS